MITNYRQPKVFLTGCEEKDLSGEEDHLKKMNINDLMLFRNSTECLQNLGYYPDIVFLSEAMEVHDNFKVLREVRRSYPKTLVVMLPDLGDVKIANSILKLRVFECVIRNWHTQFNIVDRVIRLSMCA